MQEHLPDLLPYRFDLPDAQIARHPPASRDGGRLLDLSDARSGPVDRQIRDLPSLLRPGDLLILNDVRVRRARLSARRASGGAVEVLLAGAAEALVRPGRRLKAGERLSCGSGCVELLEQLPEGRWRVALHPSAEQLEREAGAMPLPPYLGRDAEPEDEARYQTVYASGRSGLKASAAPTAGLHLTEALLAEIAGRGVEVGHVGLEVGLGTFLPLRAQQLAEGLLHEERYELPPATWEQIAACRARGGRVVAVGTTAARVLEGAAGPGVGATRLFIRPGWRFRQVDALLTNFHLPESSLLMLCCAFGGTARVMAAYRHAVGAGYRFFSYGDAMLLAPEGIVGSAGFNGGAGLVRGAV